MKKILFLMVAFVAMSFAACGNQTDAAGVNDSDSVAVDSVEVFDSVAVDTVAVDTVLAEK